MKKNNWIKEFSIQKDGFYGHLYHPIQNEFQGKSLLVLGGSGMPYQSTLDMAEAFSKMGITALAVGYYDVPGAPKTIVHVPIEFVEKAAEMLHANEAETVIAAGLSKGAELALVSATLLPQINGVIALSPSARVNMGIGSGISWTNASSWSFRGNELPYAYAPASGMRSLWDTLRARELTFLPVYERANKMALPDCIIPVEKIQGPVLVAAAKTDSLWPSSEACGEISKRLTEAGFPYPHKELVYQYATHILLPFDNSYGNMFRLGRKYPNECQKTIQELQAEVLEWLKQDFKLNNQA